jgi:hypothetical protein
MAKQKIYLIDTAKSVLSGTAITGYTAVASGAEILISASSVSLTLGKSATPDTNLGRTNAIGLYEEGEVQSNSVANRIYSIQGVLNNQVAADKLIYKYLLQIIRSPAIFGMVNELTKYGDAPHDTTYTTANLSTNILANEYVYVVFNNLTANTSADDNNIINFTIDAVLMND